MKREIDSPWQTTVELRVPFHDLDPINVAWYGNIYKYFDRARSRLMREVNYGTEAMAESGYIWPIIESHCRHINFIRGETLIRVTAGIEDFEQCLKTGYLVRDVEDDTRLAIGWTVQVAVEETSGEMQLDTPEILKRRLREAAE